MKIKILKDLNDSKETGRPSTEGIELTSVDGMFTLENTDEEIGEDIYSYNTSKTIFSEELALASPDIFEVCAELEEHSSKETFRSIDEIKEKIKSIKEDIKLLQSMLEDNDTPEVLASKYILALQSMVDILEWTINPENKHNNE